jgi:hypothetical protein
MKHQFHNSGGGSVLAEFFLICLLHCVAGVRRRILYSPITKLLLPHVLSK